MINLLVNLIFTFLFGMVDVVPFSLHSHLKMDPFLLWLFIGIVKGAK